MRGKVFAAFSLALSLPFFVAFGDPISQVNQIVAFGDSLTDTGNAHIASGGILPPSGYAVGEYTNPPGPDGISGLWIDQFASKAGLPDPQPFLAGGTNYAFAGAHTGSDNIDYVSDQLGFYLLGKTSVPSTNLYSFWAGANDIMDASNPVAAANTAASNLEMNIATLAGEGGKYFLWFNLPLLGDTPFGMSHGSTVSASWNAATVAFDTDWKNDIQSLNKTGIVVVGVDIETLFNNILTVPGHDGFNLTPEPKGMGLNGYLFSWDGLHPTSDADALIADLALTDFEAAVTPTSSVPEPASTALALFGLGALLIFSSKLKTKDRR